jgi:hypothetical protein
MLGPFHRFHDLYVELPPAEAVGVQFLPGGVQFLPGGVQFEPGDVQFEPGGAQFVKESPKICLVMAIQCSGQHSTVQPIEHLQHGLNMTRCKNVLAV